MNEVLQPPDDMAGLPIQLWPTITDQIDVARRYVGINERILKYLRPTDKEYENIRRDLIFMTAVLHTLTGIKDLLETKSQGC